MFVATLALIGGVIAAVIAVVRAPQLPQRWPLLGIAAIPAGALSFGVAHTLLCLSAIACITLWVWCNRRLSGSLLIAAGALLNLSVMAFHNGAMPITDTTLRAIGHVAPVGALLLGSKDIVIEASVWGWLGDWMIIPLGAERVMVASPGDVVLALGILWWLCFSGTARQGRYDVRSSSLFLHGQYTPAVGGTQPAPGSD